MKNLLLSLNRYSKFSLHLSFWVAYYLFNVVYLGSAVEAGYTLALSQMGVTIVFQAVAVYCNLHYFMPNFLNKNRLLVYGVVLVFSVLFLNFLMQITLNQWVYPGLCEYSHADGALINVERTLPHLITFFSVIGISTAISVIKQQRKKEKFVQDVEKQNITNELNYLKSQMQPHFFFNTLNSLYALSLKKSDLAPEVILKLSDLMSYVIYETQSKSVFLSREVKHIQDVLELEKLRHGDSLEYEIELAGESAAYQVPPLLFVPLVENAIKHGGKSPDGIIKICIRIEIQAPILLFKIKNSLNPEGPNKFKNGGVGTENLKRRLHLLFCENYTLTSDVNQDEYLVKLEIPINE